MIGPRKIIQSNDDKYLLAAAKAIGVTADELFFKLESIKNTGEINGFSVTKEKNDDDGISNCSNHYFSYVIKNMEETIRIVCAF